MKRHLLVLAAAGLALVAGVGASSAGASPIPHPGQPPWPVVVPYVGAACSAPDTGQHAYLPGPGGLADGARVLTCNGSGWS